MLRKRREPDDTLSHFSGWMIVLRLRNDLSKVTQLLNQQDWKSLPLSTAYSLSLQAANGRVLNEGIII